MKERPFDGKTTVAAVFPGGNISGRPPPPRRIPRPTARAAAGHTTGNTKAVYPFLEAAPLCCFGREFEENGVNIMPVSIAIQPSHLDLSPEEWNKWKASLGEAQIIFPAGESFADRNFSGRDLRGAIFSNSNLNGANFFDCNLAGVVFNGCNGVETKFGKLQAVQCIKCNLTKVILEGTVMDLDGAGLTDCNFFECAFKKISATDTRWVNTRFVRCNFEQITSGSTLANITLEACCFRSTQFEGVKVVNVGCDGTTEFNQVDFAGAQLGKGTNFSDALMSDCKTDRRTLEMFGPAGLSVGQRFSLAVDDPVAKMRLSFSGIMQYTHGAALVIFLTPYLLFCVQNFFEGQLLPKESPAEEAVPKDSAPQKIKTVKLFDKLVQYCATAGTYKEKAPGHIFLVSFLLLYNVNRAVLLWKTKKLEMEEASTGMPARFQLRWLWWMAYQLSNYGVWLNVTCVALHTWDFMQMPVPAPDSVWPALVKFLKETAGR